MPNQADLNFARNWLASTSPLGMNVERPWAWSIPGGVAANATYLKSKGCGLVRVFYPYRPGKEMDGPGSTARPSKEKFARLLDAVQVYVDAGFHVEACCTDVLTFWEDLNIVGARAEITAHLTDAAAWIAERNFDINKVAVGGWNELGGDDDWTAEQVEWFGIMRAALPNHLLIAGTKYWNHYSRLTEAPPFTDDGRVLWPMHCYEAHTVSGWKSIAADLDAWAEAHGGLVITFAEAGAGGQDVARDPSAWAANLNALIDGMARFKPTFWAQTQGLDWQLNESATTATLRAAIVTILEASIETGLPAADQPWFVPGIPPIPPDLDLGGPYGRTGDQTDSELPIDVRKSLAWVVEKAHAILAYAEAVAAHAQAADAAEAANRLNTDTGLNEKLNTETDDRAAADASLDNLKAPKHDPNLTGFPQSATPTSDSYTQQIATTAWTKDRLYDATVNLASKNSPAFTGTPTAPAPAGGSWDTQIPTTSWVQDRIYNKANSNSPEFTGTPTAPTPAAGDDTTKLATTAYSMRTERYIFAQIRDTQGLGQAADDASAAGAGVPVGRLYYTSAGAVRRRMA